MQKHIGFSTGFNFKKIDPLQEIAVSNCLEVSANTLEVNCLSGTGGLLDLGRLIPKIEHLSLHGPGSVLKKITPKAIKEHFDTIEEFCKIYNPKCVVFHPNTIKDWTIFDDYSFPVAIENMDPNKSSGQTVDQVGEVLSKLKNGKFVLDITHCFSIDHTMKLADDFLGSFSDKLCEIHLSGWGGKYHVPIYESGQTIILEFASKIDSSIPIIIESFCSVEQLKPEFDYIKGFFDKI
jgi:hypothetical protein